MSEQRKQVPRSVQLNAAIVGTGAAADSRAILVYKALGINRDRFNQALQIICGEAKTDLKNSESPIRKPDTSDYFIFLGALSATAVQRGVKRESEGFPLGSWEGKDGKVDGKRNLFFVPSMTSSDSSPFIVVDIKDPAQPKRIGAISLRKERIEGVAEFSGDPRLIPETVRPNFGTFAKLTSSVHNVQVGDPSLQFITQAALKQLGI